MGVNVYAYACVREIGIVCSVRCAVCGEYCSEREQFAQRTTGPHEGNAGRMRTSFFPMRFSGVAPFGTT
jgi:hypothetical protein